MSDSTVRNLLRGTGDGTWANYADTKESTTAFGTKVVSCVRNSSKSYQSMNVTTVSGLVPRKGDSVTLTFWCSASAECVIYSYLYSDSGSGGNARKHADDGTTSADGWVTTKVGTDWTYARHTWTYDEDAGGAPKSIVARLMGGVPSGVKVSVAGVMLVAGDAPAAWAPADGETLAGGGALVSANLWDASSVNYRPNADGVYIVGKSTGGLQSAQSAITGASAFAENQTVHMGTSLRGADKGALKPFVEYKDAAGNFNWVGFPAWTPTDQWQRFEGSCVVPSGMTISQIGFNASAMTGNAEVTNPSFSYGSPVTLASSAHTPYATQDHVSTVYATKASLKVTDDSIKAEVSARAQTDGTVSDLSSRLTQTADGLRASIDSLSETDKKVNSWFDFDADASGNPQLKMGSSASPVVGIYTNTGLAYRSRDDATIMELDASRSATISDHMEAQDVTIGKWKWVQTQGGTHLTLVWAG